MAELSQDHLNDLNQATDDLLNVYHLNDLNQATDDHLNVLNHLNLNDLIQVDDFNLNLDQETGWSYLHALGKTQHQNYQRL